MTPDIVPYSADDCEGIAGPLVKLNVPCFGPGTGIELIRIADAVKREIEKLQQIEGTDDICVVLNGYRHRILDIALVNAHMQKEVIGQLEKAIKG